MIVNCLPLYEPPPNGESVQASTSFDATSKSRPEEDTESSGNLSRIKARSVEVLDTVAAELELHDQDYQESKSDDESYSQYKPAAPRKWSRMSASYTKNLTVVVHEMKGEATGNEHNMRSEERKRQIKNQESTDSVGGGSNLEGERESQGSLSDETRGGTSHSHLPAETPKHLLPETSEPDTDKEKTAPELSTEVVKEKPFPEPLTDFLEGVPIEEDHKVSTVDGEAVVNLEGDPIEEDHNLPEVSTVDGEAVVNLEGDPIEEDHNLPEVSTVDGKTVVKESPSFSKKLHESISSPIYEVDENGSDDDDKYQVTKLTVNYLDSFTMSTLKRSSGSVSFFNRTNTSGHSGSAMDGGIHENNKTESSVGKLPALDEAVLSRGNATPSPPPSSASPFTQPLQDATPTNSDVLPLSLLPISPCTIDPDYTERSGWLNKLSHRKGVFGDRWQKRYFVLHRSWLYYFKKYGVSCYWLGWGYSSPFSPLVLLGAGL